MDIEVSTCADGCTRVRIGNQTSCLSDAEARDLLAKLINALNEEPVQ